MVCIWVVWVIMLENCVQSAAEYFQPLSEAPVMNLMFALLVTHYR